MLLLQVLEERRKPTSLFTYKINFEHIENFFFGEGEGGGRGTYIIVMVIIMMIIMSTNLLNKEGGTGS